MVDRRFLTHSRVKGKRGNSLYVDFTNRISLWDRLKHRINILKRWFKSLKF